MSRVFAACAVLSACCLLGADAKGSSGAVNGGSYRGWRQGTYSRRIYMNYAPIYLMRGRYAGSRSNGGSTSRGQDDAGEIDPSVKGDNTVFCRRDVTLDTAAYAASTTKDTVVLNSTRYCYKQTTTVNGAPENLPLLSMWLDVFQWTLSAPAGGYPFVEMRQSEDKDLPNFSPKAYLKLLMTALYEKDPSGAVVQTISTNDAALKWTSYRRAPAGYETWGYPASYYRDQARLVTFSLRVQNSDLDVTITFTAADDFAESPFVDRSFMRPSGLAIDVTVKKFPFKSTSSGQIGVEFVLAHMDTLPSMYGAAPAQRHGTEYDPRLRNRVEVGNMASQDMTVRGRHYFSWAANINQRELCLDSTMQQAGCTQFGGLKEACPQGTDCSSYNLPAGTKALRLQYTGSLVNSTFYNGTMGEPCKNFTWMRARETQYVALSMTLGTYDTSEATTNPPPASGSALMSRQAMVMVIMGAVAILLL